VGSPRYKIGDLVRACFTYFEFYTYPYYEEDDDLFYPWSGIIVDMYWDEDYFGDDAIYDVLCTDGTQRLFAEWELMLIQR